MIPNYDPLIEQLRNATLVAFVGAGVSCSYTDPSSGRAWNGLPAASEIVQRLAEKRTYLTPQLSFSQACFLLKAREGRNELERFLLDTIDKPGIPPLPAHVILANLPFSSYLTTNYDNLLERALNEAKRKFQDVIVDDDVCRLRPTHVPVLKLHGCISRPQTIVAAEDEYQPWATKYPIIEALVKTHLANKAILFLGFSLSDVDLTRVFDEMKGILGERMPRSYAIVNSTDEYLSEYWKDKGVQVICSDLTEFLRGLLRASAETSRPVVYNPGEDWINNDFFVSLHRIRTLPSETQVCDAFLDHFLQEMRGPTFSLDDVLNRATRAATMVLSRRPHLEGLKKLSSSLIAEIRAKGNNKEQAEVTLQKVIGDRSSFARGFSQKATQVVERGDNLLLYSQSMRVLQLLKGVPRGIQDTCHVFVAECRPKSPHPFQDALSICENLLGTGYELTVVPDAAVGNLVQRKQITKICLGAHAVYCRGSQPVSFVNTCGSYLIASVAQQTGTAVFVMAETPKIVAVEDSDPEPVASFQEEEELFAPVTSALSELKASGQKLSAINIGYDLCPFTKNMTLITEA